MNETNTNSFTTIKKALNYVGKIISTAILVILILIGLFLVYYVICAKVVSKKPGYEPPINLYTIVSGSMEPNINVYDVVFDVRVDNPEDIKIGDVITFRSTSSISKDLIVTHRVIDIKKNGEEYEYVTKGDNNPTSDSDTAKYNNIIGVVKLKFPQLGRIQFFVSSKLGWFLIVLLPAMCVIIYDVIKIIKMMDTKRTAKNIKKTVDIPQKEDNIQELRKLNETLEKIEHSNYDNKLIELQEIKIDDMQLQKPEEPEQNIPINENINVIQEVTIEMPSLKQEENGE